MALNPLAVAGTAIAGALFYVRKSTTDNSRVQLVHAPETAKVSDTKTVLDVVNECPTLSDPERGRFVPSALLANGDLMTCYNTVKQMVTGRRPSLVEYERELLRTEDGGTIGIDWSPPFSKMPEDGRPVVVLSHGLSGGSQEVYIQETIKVLTSPPYSFRAVVVNYRGCAGVKLTSHILYNAGFTSDYGFALDHIRARLPRSKFVAVGYSLGANLVTKYAGEQGDKCPLAAAVSVCNPYDLDGSTDYIERPTLKNRMVYTPAMLLGLQRIATRHMAVMKAGPIEYDFEAIPKIKRIREFDDLITSKTFGYRDAREYYRANSCGQFMAGIRVPFLAISSADDPVCPEQLIPRAVFETNPYLVLAMTAYGGHLGYHEALGKGPWFPRPIAEFCQAVFCDAGV